MTASGLDAPAGHSGTSSLNLAPWGTVAAILAGLTASGCATTGPNKPASDKFLSSGFASTKSKLQYCDELACYHEPVRYYYIREIRCPDGTPPPVICDYERAETDNPFPEPTLESKRRLGIAKPGGVEVPLKWEKARSVLNRSTNGGGGWVIDSR